MLINFRPWKSAFKTRDSHYCYHLTMADRYSRYLLGCQGLLSTETEGAKAIFYQLFKKYGLPQAIRCGQRHSLRLNRTGAALGTLSLVDQARHQTRTY